MARAEWNDLNASSVTDPSKFDLKGKRSASAFNPELTDPP
jgi:hypothetical protein